MMRREVGSNRYLVFFFCTDAEEFVQGRAVLRPPQKNLRKKDRKERRRERREALRKWGRRLALFVGLAAVGLGLPYAIYQGYSYTMSSEYFALAYVDVEGLVYLDEDALLAAAEDIAGEHIFNVHPRRLEATIATLPFVAAVEVERRLPDRLYIAITEYEPVAIVVDDGFWLADGYGEVFLSLDMSLSEGELWQLPLISGLTRADLSTWQGREDFASALQVYRVYHEMGLDELQSVSEVHVDRVMGISIIVGETGTEVRLGRGRWRERLERLEVVQESLIRRGVDAAYVLIDQEQDLSRVAVGRRTGPGNGDVEESHY